MEIQRTDEICIALNKLFNNSGISHICREKINKNKDENWMLLLNFSEESRLKHHI